LLKASVDSVARIAAKTGFAVPCGAAFRPFAQYPLAALGLLNFHLTDTTTLAVESHASRSLLTASAVSSCISDSGIDAA
jgi:hypothetical protein